MLFWLKAEEDFVLKEDGDSGHGKPEKRSTIYRNERENTY